MNNLGITFKFFLLYLGCFACQGPNDPTGEINRRQATLEKENLSMDYDICGDGELSVVFIHGWCIDRSYWDAQIDTLCPRFKVIAMDLPGHGSSYDKRDQWSLEQYGQDVAALINNLDLEKVILVGHSMGGYIMLEAALLQNDRVIGLVGVDNFKDSGMPVDSATQVSIDQFMEALKSDYITTVEYFANEFLFSDHTDSVSRDRIIISLLEADSLMAIAVLQSVFRYADKEISQLSALDQKLYLINSDVTPTNTTYLNQQGVNVEIVNIAGTGHYPMIEKPQMFNTLLLQTLNKIRESHK